MRIYDLLTEGINYPIICVDVQPEYSSTEPDKLEDIVKFVAGRTGPVLMFVNAEETGVSGDTIDSIKHYWEEIISPTNYDEDEDEEKESPINWNRFKIIDKGYGHLRAWMDLGVPENVIIKMIRLLYQEKKTDSRDLFGGEDSSEYAYSIKEFMGNDYIRGIEDEYFAVNWVSVSLLKKFSGAYIVGGGRNQCLREVELIMNAFNIKYKRINHLVYG